MSKELRKLIAKNPKLIAEYRTFIIRVLNEMPDYERKLAAASAAK